MNWLLDLGSGTLIDPESAPLYHCKTNCPTSELYAGTAHMYTLHAQNLSMGGISFHMKALTASVGVLELEAEEIRQIYPGWAVWDGEEGLWACPCNFLSLSYRQTY